MAPEDGETFEGITERAADFLRDILEKHKNDERVMVVAHGAINKAMMRFFRHNEVKDFWEGSLQRNCGVTIVDCRDGKYDIIAENKVFYEYKKA